MATLLYRLGHFAVRRRRYVVAFWVLLLVGAGLLNGALGGKTSDSFKIPGTESQKAADLLETRFPAQSGSIVQVVYQADKGISFHDATGAAALTKASAVLATQPGVAKGGVTDPSATGTISKDGTIAYAQVAYTKAATDIDKGALDSLQAAATSAVHGTARAEFGGQPIDATSQGGPESSEAIGLAVAVVVLLIAFGSVLAMGLPLVTALIGVGLGSMGIGILSAMTDLSATAPILATMIGLAVGIDYALFIVTRHRQNLAAGIDVEESAARANATAGGAVVFAGLTVVIALAGLSVVGVPFLTTMGLAAAFTVLLAVLIAISMLPALLGFCGHNIDKLRLPGLKVHSGADDPTSWSNRWARRVTDRPVRFLIGGLLVMGVLAIPLFSMRLGMTDDGTASTSTTQRQAYDLLGTGFGKGFNGPLTLVVDLNGATDRTGALQEIRTEVAKDPDVVMVSAPKLNPAGNTAVLTAVPRSAPSDAGTGALVHRIRDHVVPATERVTGTDVSVAGPTASNIDVSDKLASALPEFMAVVIGLTVILLLVVFRSIVVPAKAALAILLSIGASFGVLVAVFQWGWGQSLVGLDTTVPIISFLPLMMFAILFGLSMDYEVFILSRIREDYVRTGDAHHSVLSGLGNSARVITAAALIMISVFASFILGDNVVIKMFGIGLSAAVFLDATVVRMVIVPAVMTLFDRTAWWLPGWLDRLLPNLDVEGERLIEALDAHDGGRHQSAPNPVPALDPVG